MNNYNTKPKPFLIWVGGKRKIVKQITAMLPNEYNNYYEIFLGGGALFFETLNKNSYISDINLDLINTYKAVKHYPYELIDLLEIHSKKYSKEYFYKIRSMHFLTNVVEAASRFIYLNKTCFLGMHTVNKKNEFSNTFGYRKNPAIYEKENIIACSKALQNTTICKKNYTDVSEPKKNDFVYLDPPYHPTTTSKGYNKYTKERFHENDQISVAEYCKKLDKQGVKFILSNSDTDFIYKLYSSFDIITVDVVRHLSGKESNRGRAKEVLIKNY